MNRPIAAMLTISFTIASANLTCDAEAGSLFSAARSAIAKRALRPAPLQAAGRPRDVIIYRSKHPEAAAHIEQAQRTGQPTILHIDRLGAADRRGASTGSVNLQPKPAPHYERDEYPPAMTREGGHNADVRFISSHDNRGSGSSMRAQTRDLPDGSKIRVVVTD